MKQFKRYILFLILFEISVLGIGFLVTEIADINLQFSEIAALSGIFTILTSLLLLIVFRGLSGDAGRRTLHILVAIGLKFIVELVFAFLWFFVGKKIELSSVLLFFVLYLAFTLFSTLVILKTLNYKSL